MRSPSWSRGTPGPRASSGRIAGWPRSGPPVTRTNTVLQRPPPAGHGWVSTLATVPFTSWAGVPKVRAARWRWWAGHSTIRPTVVASTKGTRAAASSRRTLSGVRAAEWSWPWPAMSALCWSDPPVSGMGGGAPSALVHLLAGDPGGGHAQVAIERHHVGPAAHGDAAPVRLPHHVGRVGGRGPDGVLERHPGMVHDV